MVLPALKKQLQASTPGEYDCLFVRKVDGIDTAGLSLRDQTVFERISNKIYPLGQVLETRVEALSIQRLVSRGLVEVSGVTPSDACHGLDLLDTGLLLDLPINPVSHPGSHPVSHPGSREAPSSRLPSRQPPGRHSLKSPDLAVRSRLNG